MIVGTGVGSSTSAKYSSSQAGGVGCCFPNLQAWRLCPPTSRSAQSLANHRTSLNRYVLGGKPIGMSACGSFCQRTGYTCASLSCSFFERVARPLSYPRSCHPKCRLSEHCCVIRHLMLMLICEGIHCVCISSRVIECWIPKVLVPRGGV